MAGQRGSEPEGSGLLERVLMAERAAEAALAEARARHDAILDAARAGAQEIERRTDRRIEACRDAYSSHTRTLAQEIAAGAPDEGGARPAAAGGDCGGDVDCAARVIAQRLLGRA